MFKVQSRTNELGQASSLASIKQTDAKQTSLQVECVGSWGENHQEGSQRAGEKAQLVRCLLREHSHTSSDDSTFVERADVVTQVCLPSGGEVEMGRPPGPSGQLVYPSQRGPSSERLCLKEKDEEHLIKDIQPQLLAFTFTHNPSPM